MFLVVDAPTLANTQPYRVPCLIDKFDSLSNDTKSLVDVHVSDEVGVSEIRHNDSRASVSMSHARDTEFFIINRVPLGAEDDERIGLSIAITRVDVNVKIRNRLLPLRVGINPPDPQVRPGAIPLFYVDTNVLPAVQYWSVPTEHFSLRCGLLVDRQGNSFNFDTIFNNANGNRLVAMPDPERADRYNILHDERLNCSVKEISPVCYVTAQSPPAPAPPTGGTAVMICPSWNTIHGVLTFSVVFEEPLVVNYRDAQQAPLSNSLYLYFAWDPKFFCENYPDGTVVDGDVGVGAYADYTSRIWFYN